MDLSSKSLTSLNAMTKAQIITALTEGRTETKTIISAGDKRGQLQEVRETRDLAGNLVRSQEVNWTYYKAENVDTITVIDRDGKGKELNLRVIKHNELGGLAGE